MAWPDLGPWMMSARCLPNGLASTDMSKKLGPFVAHGGRIPIIMADGHVQALKLIQTVVPTDMWKSSRADVNTQRELLGVIKNMADEYK